MVGIVKKDFSSAIGQVAALSIAIETVIFALSLIWELISPSALAQNLGYIASFLLAISVVTMMACFYHGVPEERKVFGLLALVFSVIYAPFCLGTYFLQLSVVALNPLDLSAEVMKVIAFKPASPIFALDMLGYGFLCLSTLAAGFALTEAEDKPLRLLCFFHGALVFPTLASPILSGVFLSASGETDPTGHYVLLFWCVVFLPMALLFMRYFKGKRPSPSQ
jgi:hypothetical protein